MELKELAKQGNPQAQFELAIQYLQNRDPEGLTWLKEAAKNGHPKAYEVITNMNAHNPEDDDKVINMLKKNADNGDVNSQFALGVHYEYGHFGLRIDPNEALNFYKMAIKNGLKGNNLDFANDSIVKITGGVK